MDRLQAANRPGWSQYAAGDAVEVRLDDVWEPGEMKELHQSGSTFVYRVWLIDRKIRHVLEVSRPDEFDGVLQRRHLTT